MNTSTVLEIPSFTEMLSSLPEVYRTEKIQTQLQRAYDLEVSAIREAVSRLESQGRPYAVRMCTFYCAGGNQWLAEFSVKDLSLPEVYKYNWHMQNTSQWVYAGAILFDQTAFEHNPDYCISRHH